MAIRTALLILVATAALSAQAPSSSTSVDALIQSPRFKTAGDALRKDHDRFVKELIALTEIPAPPFKEQKRAEAVLALLKQTKLTNVEIDQEGNVMGLRRGTGDGSIVAILAHIDTVFPEGTDVKVKREGNRLMAPGIGDDTRGVALMLALIRAMDAAGFQTTHDILFVGNVGEEGEGDLRGAKHLMLKGKYKDRIKQFIAIDGGEQSTITNGGVGSRRYRVAFKGPGGHSYGAFGLVNPAFAMGNAIVKFGRIQVPTKPKTTYSVGVVSGGTSVNSIPFEVSMDIDMRSESCAELDKVEKQFLGLVKEAVDEENKARSTREGPITADPKKIGDRPCGETAVTSPIVQTTSAVIKAFGLTPRYNISSTDSNLPMSLGIPAVTIGRGPGGRAHSLDEYTDIGLEEDTKAAQVALAIVLSVAGVK
jgi:acetylornithine deacetylase/succinyl-diaminopimelate desuccinylase-like protein